jgi:hypothetical protein
MQQAGNTCPHLLLGNGFSVACDTRFGYTSLVDVASQVGAIDQQLVDVFDHLCTANIEGVMQEFNEAAWLAQHFGVQLPFVSQCVDQLREAFLAALTVVHPDTWAPIDHDRMEICAAFVEPYGRVFTTNYDLLLYWVLNEVGPQREDSFGNWGDAPGLLTFSRAGLSTATMFYLHGALHLYESADWTVKRRRCGTDPLLTSIRAELAAGEVPLFVSEGSAGAKAARVAASEYLSTCMQVLRNTDGTLVIYGHSLSDADAHIRAAIAEARGLDRLFVGLYGDPDSPSNATTRGAAERIAAERQAFGGPAVQVHYYDSSTARVWG